MVIAKGDHMAQLNFNAAGIQPRSDWDGPAPRAPRAPGVIWQSEARAQGLPRYFTGSPCSRFGHVAERWVVGALCCACFPNQPKPKSHAAPTADERAERHARRQGRYENDERAFAWSAAVYAEAHRLTRATGVMHEVDHIVPRKGKALVDGRWVHVVSGLDVPANLRVLPAAVNGRKSNRHWPDMP